MSKTTGTSENRTPTIAFIGAGKVTSALARLWAAHGYAITAIASRTPAHAEYLAAELSAKVVSTIEAVKHADLIILSVPDDSIMAVAQEIAPAEWAGKAAVHTSGAHNRDILKTLQMRGAMTGSIHPAYPFANTALQPDMLRGITFAVESDNPTLSGWLAGLIKTADGQMLHLKPENKALYHAALVLTSNYAVTLYATGRQILMGLGADAEAADGALLSLLGGTLDNLQARGVPDALTGPLVREDIGTIEAHLDALQGMPDIKTAYLMLARLTLPLLAERGISTRAIEALLNQRQF